MNCVGAENAIRPENDGAAAAKVGDDVVEVESEIEGEAGARMTENMADPRMPARRSCWSTRRPTSRSEIGDHRGGNIEWFY